MMMIQILWHVQVKMTTLNKQRGEKRFQRKNALVPSKRIRDSLGKKKIHKTET